MGIRVVSPPGPDCLSGVTLLFHRDLGGQGKTPLIILHGLLGSSRNWQTAGADLNADAHVLALDLRNHGKSFHALEMDYAGMARDVFAWIRSQGISEFYLMGHSMGGKVALRMAVDAPECVKRLIVVDIAPKSYHSNAHRNEFAGMNEMDLRTLASRTEAELRLEGRVEDWAIRKFLVTNLERDESGQGWRWAVNLPVLTQALPTLESSPLYPEEHYDGPALLIRGGRSRYVTEEDWPVIEKHLPRVQRLDIASAGHNPHMETRDAFVRGVRRFLAEAPLR